MLAIYHFMDAEPEPSLSSSRSRASTTNKSSLNHNMHVLHPDPNKRHLMDEDGGCSTEVRSYNQRLKQHMAVRGSSAQLSDAGTTPSHPPNELSQSTSYSTSSTSHDISLPTAIRRAADLHRRVCHDLSKPRSTEPVSERPDESFHESSLLASDPQTVLQHQIKSSRFLPGYSSEGPHVQSTTASAAVHAGPGHSPLHTGRISPKGARPPSPRDFESEFGDSSALVDSELRVNAPRIIRDAEDDDVETVGEFMNRLTHVLGQMMFVSGETAEPSTETTWMIEEIVRDQVIEMLKEATLLANRRGSKSISIVDLIFQIRHNPAKVSRLKTFLSWKDVRKNVKDSDDKAGGADADALDLDEGALPGANPAAPQKSSTNKKAKLMLPWEIQSYYNETVPEREDEEDEEEEEQNEATLARLASADERTKDMTREEYVFWSECRQASFTFRKGKRFREWAGFGTIIDSKPNDDVVDILGFLTFEIVQTLTEEALRVKVAEDLANKKASGLRGDNEASKRRKREGCTLFEMPEEDRTPVEPKHVREAFRRLQLVPKKYIFMRQGYAGVRTPLRMI